MSENEALPEDIAAAPAPWLEPPPQAGQHGHLKEHTNWRNWFKKFWDDVVAGNYPDLIGPEGPMGPQGKPGPSGPGGTPGEHGEDGVDGFTPEAAHIRLNHFVTEAEEQFEECVYEWVAEPDGPLDDVKYAMEKDVYVHLNGVMLTPGLDYLFDVKTASENDPYHRPRVTFKEPLYTNDVIDVVILFAFGVTTRGSAVGNFVSNEGGETGILPEGVWGIKHVDKRVPEQTLEKNRGLIYIVWDGIDPNPAP